MFNQHWLASLPFPVSGRHSRDRRGEARGRLANQKSRSDWRRVARYSSSVVQGHTTVHSWTIWLMWLATSLVVIRPPQCWLDPATKVIFQMTSRRQHAITWHVCTLLLPGRTLPNVRQQQQHRPRSAKWLTAYLETHVLQLKCDVTTA